MSDFVVRIDHAKLSAAQANRVAAAIQGAVLSELGDLDLAPPTTKAAGGGVGSLILSPFWRGIWIANMKSLIDENAAGKTLQVSVNPAPQHE